MENVSVYTVYLLRKTRIHSVINRYYICDACGHSMVVRQELHDEKRLKKCPACKKNKLYQDLTGQHTFVYSEPKTVGHLADRNSERAGKYELEDKRRELKRSFDKPKLEKLKKAGIVKESAEELPEVKNPWFNPEGKNLSKELKPILDNPKKIKKYIKDGRVD